MKELLKQWNKLSDKATNTGHAYADIDALHWFNYTAFDIIGDLVHGNHTPPRSQIYLADPHAKQAFGAPFGMLSRGRDIAEVRRSPSSSPTYAPAIEVLNRRGEVSATLGCLPSLKPYAAYLPDPFFRAGLQAIQDLAGIAVARVNERVASAQEDGKEPQRNDLLARLLEARDENGEKLSREEVTGEALGQLIAGSDTTSNTLCALLYWCLKTPGVMDKLRAEIDEAVPDDVDIPSYDTVKELP